MTDQDWLDLLIQKIPPPVAPDRAPGTAMNAHFGPSIPLPDDYRLFLDVFGPGSFLEDGWPALKILDLVSPLGQRSVEELLVIEWNNRNFVSPQIPEELGWPPQPPPIYPKAPGLLPWAMFDQGFTFYWWAEGSPNSWRVVVDARSEMIRYPYSMLEFLVINLSSYAGDKFFEDGEVRFSGFQPGGYRFEGQNPQSGGGRTE